MTDDATLTDFVEADERGDADDGDGRASDRKAEEARESPPEERDATDDGGAASDAETASLESTYAWGGSYACAACGSSVDRVWRDDGDVVCETCKRW